MNKFPVAENNFRDIRKIIVFVSSPFNIRDEKRFGIKILQKNGYEVEVWDFSPFLNPQRYNDFQQSDKSDFKKHRIFLRPDDAIYAIRQLPRNCCLVILHLDIAFKSYHIYRAFQKSGLACCFVMYHFPCVGPSLNRSWFMKIRKVTLEKIKDYLFNRFFVNAFFFPPAAIVFLLGGNNQFPRLPVNKATKIIRANYFDYDLYLEEIQKPVEYEKNTGVFLDNYLPFHSDCAIDKSIPAEKYYPLLCKFFDHVEKTYGKKIIIAAHPRSDYGAHPDYFGGRLVLKGGTAELVRKSGFVLLHDSASLTFAVLFNKPMIFMNAGMLKDGPVGGITETLSIDFIAALFSKKPINIDSPFAIDWDKEMIINEEAYRNYKNTYIKKEGTEDLPIWQIFVNHLKNA